MLYVIGNVNCDPIRKALGLKKEIGTENYLRKERLGYKVKSFGGSTIKQNCDRSRNG